MKRLFKFGPIIKSLAFIALGSVGSLRAQTSAQQQNVAKIQLVTTSGSQSNGNRSVTVTLPPDAVVGALKATLNGKDITSNFTPTECKSGDGVCYSGAVSGVDGLNSRKNVLYVTSQRQNGGVASSHIRFEGDEGGAPASGAFLSARSLSRPGEKALQNSVPAYMDPSITFVTNTPGGYQTGYPWFTIAATTYPTNGSYTCSLYAVIVLNRQTLTQIDSSPYCAGDGATLTNYLSSLSGNYLVIVGTVNGQNADSTLNTSSIGGTDYTKLPSGTNPPLGYMAIGVPGAPPGQAFENYYTTGNPSPNPSNSNPQAQGMLVEDMNGNYNFESSDALEYVVAPNDPNYPGQSTVAVSAPRSVQQSTGVTKYIYTSGTQAIGGFYLLILQREDLESNPNCKATSSSNGIDIYEGCGTFYPTGDPSNAGANATAAYMALAKALKGLQRNELAFLTTVGNAAFANTANPEYQVASTGDGKGNYAFYGSNGTDGLWATLGALGAPVFDILYLYPQTSVQTFTYVTAPGLGNSLNGRSVLSTSVYTQQGETGYVHGLLQRDTNGLYAPGHTSQETSGSSDYANFTIGKVASLQPTPWPERLSTATPGQQGAYAYLSYYLLNAQYVQGISGPHQYDIHYFFTGSLNTLINYHTFDPSQVVWPGNNNNSAYNCNGGISAGTCTWNSPDPNYPLTVSFSQADFNTVASELHGEVTNLTNVLTFMVTGSVNMKDVVAAGSANSALALVGAAGTVEGSSLQPSPTAPVKIDVGNLLGMIGAGLNIAASIGTGGLVPSGTEEATIESIDTTVDVIGDLLGQSSTFGGGLFDGSKSKALPGSNFSFVSEIGQLANMDLQGQMSAGFDSTLDVLVSDPVKLTAIGPLVTNTNSLGFYSPQQTAQNVALALINQGTQRSLYLSLVPQKYQVQYWPTVYSGLTNGHSNNAADMGWIHNGDEYITCNTFYAQSPPTYANFWVPTYNGVGQAFSQDWSDPSIDYYVLASPFQNTGKSNASANYADVALLNSLFSDQNGGLNFPLHAFMADHGPMYDTSVPLTNTWMNAGLTNITGYKSGNICSGQQTIDGGGQTGVGASPGTQYNTAVTLTAPSSSVLGDSVAMSVTVTSKSGTIPSGTVEFDDGSTVLGTATLDATGKGGFTANGLALGSHTLLAYYLTNGNNEPSVSAPVMLTVYSTAPDMLLSLSASTVTAGYDSTSAPITLNVDSKWGMNGNVKFSCSGLPIGMTCNFTPASAALSGNGSISTSFTITGNAPVGSSVIPPKGAWIVLLLPVAILLPMRIGRGRRWITQTLMVVLLSSSAILGNAGCGGNSKVSSSLQETGSKNIQIIATSGDLTRTIPLVVTIR